MSGDALYEHLESGATTVCRAWTRWLAATMVSISLMPTFSTNMCSSPTVV